VTRGVLHDLIGKAHLVCLHVRPAAGSRGDLARQSSSRTTVEITAWRKGVWCERSGSATYTPRVSPSEKSPKTGKRRIQTREFVSKRLCLSGSSVAMKVIHALDRNHVFQMMIAWAATWQRVGFLAALCDSSQLDRFLHKTPKPSYKTSPRH